jgi:hypothetical protein
MNDHSQFDDQQRLQPYLLPSERVLWTGRPPTGFLFRRSDLFLLPFSLLWAGFAVFWEFMAWKQGAPWFFLLFGGAFVVAGVFFVAGRFAYDMMVRDRTVYAVTDARALVLGGMSGRMLTSMQISKIGQVGLELHDQGRGTITFGDVSPVAMIVRTPGWPGTGRYVLPTFERIEDAAEVYRLLHPEEKRI